jgi:hypoxanthine-guanine phosphoribosyltransferase
MPLSAIDRVVSECVSGTNASTNPTQPNLSSTNIAETITRHATILAEQTTIGQVKESIQFIVQQCTKLRETIRTNDAGNESHDATTGEIHSQFAEIDEFIEEKSVLILTKIVANGGTHPSVQQLSSNDAIEELQSMIAAWESQNGAVQTIQALVAANQSANATSSAAPIPTDRQLSNLRVSAILTSSSADYAAAVPGALPSPSASATTQGTPDAASPAESPLVQLVRDVSKEARKTLAARLIEMVLTAERHASQIERSQSLWALLSHVVPLPRLAYEFQQSRHQHAWHISELLDNHAAPVSLDELQKLAQKIATTFEQDAPMLAELFVPLCEQHVALNTQLAAAG